MKFDVIIGNPPYQDYKLGNNKTSPIWDKFVTVAFLHLKPGGYLSFIHPSGWRDIDGRYKSVQELLRSKKVLYLEMHDINDGRKTFGASTRYDLYCVQNTPSDGSPTTVKFQDGTISKYNLTEYEFIPNSYGEDIRRLFPKNEESVEVIHSRSAYGTDKPHMHNEKNKKFKYPCIAHVGVDDVITCMRYSSHMDNGHFGVPKLVFGRRRSGVFLDETGEYGVCSDCAAIVDTKPNLRNIQKAIKSDKFLKLMKAFDFGGLGSLYNHKLIATFRKDFWKEFI